MPFDIDSTFIAITLAITIVVQLSLARLIRLWRRAKKHWRLYKGRRAEVSAERMLRRAGYRILARQVELSWPIEVDGEEHIVELRADLLVRRGRRRLIAEVKSGHTAPRIENIPTRRQLLEYAVAYPVDGILLVDMTHNVIHEITFPMPVADRRHLQGAVLAALLVGVAVGALAAAAWVG